MVRQCAYVQSPKELGAQDEDAVSPSMGEQTDDASQARVDQAEASQETRGDNCRPLDRIPQEFVKGSKGLAHSQPHKGHKCCACAQRAYQRRAAKIHEVNPHV
jgi:hypothetical protein